MSLRICLLSATLCGGNPRAAVGECWAPCSVASIFSKQRVTPNVIRYFPNTGFPNRSTGIPLQCATDFAGKTQQRALTTCSIDKPSKILPGNEKVVKVKVCGITSPEDAALATKEGASFIGMILWPRAKRSVSHAVASEIAKVARAGSAEPVAVFVDENAETIIRVCNATTIRVAQLHGDAARAALPGLLNSGLSLVYVMHADKDGRILTPVPEELMSASRQGRPLVDWLLIDGAVGGSGESYDWRNLQPPVGISKNGWLLAGGLNPSNVASATSIAMPDVVDVSSGVAGPDGVRKDPARILAFFEAVRGKSHV